MEALELNFSRASRLQMMTPLKIEVFSIYRGLEEV
jgi:hypothetical protein